MSFFSWSSRLVAARELSQAEEREHLTPYYLISKCLRFPNTIVTKVGSSVGKAMETPSRLLV